jgi:alpha-D-ribose 1-methylphosphonate 5-triphosphate synthase subunit PhnG
MTREERFEALAIAWPDRLIALADRVLETLQIEVTRGPSVGLLMVRHEEPVQRLTFNLVEVTVTEAEVLAGNERGYAMIMGRDPEHALAAAIVDVAIELGHPITSEAELMLKSAIHHEQRAWKDEWADVAPTTVRFEEAL